MPQELSRIETHTRDGLARSVQLLGAMRTIAHVLRKYDPEQWGGTETHVAALTRGLLRHGWRAEVHAPLGPRAEEHALADQVRLRRFRAFCPFLASAETREALYANAGNIASLHGPLQLLRDSRVQLAHLHTLGRIGGGVRSAMRLSGRPYVLSVHGPLLAQRAWLEADTARRLEKTIDLGKPLGWLLGSRRVLHDAARVFTFNREEHAAIAEQIGDRAILCEQGVDVARMRGGTTEGARALWPELVKQPLIVVVGRLCEQKNQRLAVRAFAAGASEDHQLVLAGAATDLGYRETILREARELGVGNRVHLLGNLQPTDVPHLFACADFVLVPSRHEAFGLVLLEAWAAGRAVLFRKTSGLANIGEQLDDHSPMIDTEDPRAWAAAIRAFCNHGALRKAAAGAGHRLAVRRYDWEVLTRHTATVYQQVLEERPMRSSSASFSHLKEYLQT